MNTVEIVRLLLARAESYGLTRMAKVKGRLYDVTLDATQYRTVILSSSFDFYRARYHIARTQPSLIICYVHDSVLPIPVLSLKRGNLAKPYELPEGIPGDVKGLAALRLKRSQVAAQVVLGEYLSGTQLGREIMNDETLHPSTRNRYLARVAALNKRRRGRPVTTEVKA